MMSWARRLRIERAMVVVFALVVACSSGEKSTATTSTSQPAHPRDDELTLNMIRAVGTHNSYHVRPPKEVMDAMDAVVPGLSRAFDYEHRSLTEQLERLGVRQFELDVFADPTGGLFSRRKVYEAAGLKDRAVVRELDEPGFKVLHVQEVDPESSCPTLRSCLEELLAWSEANPGHAPIMVLVEVKDDPIPDPLGLGFAQPVEVGAEELDDLDREIREVIPRDKMITPDDVRGGRDTLREAVVSRGWPTLGETRGKFLFALDNGGDVMEEYQRSHPSLRGRIMFTGGDGPQVDEAAFMKLNDPIADKDRIREMVEQGFVVRTRADSDPNARLSDLEASRAAALESGAHWISTDFPEPQPTRGHRYAVSLEGGRMVGCNPLTAPSDCDPNDVENPDLLQSG